MRLAPPVKPQDNGIAVERDGVVRVGSGVCQSALPQAFGIEWLTPGTMIAFVNGLTQRDARLLENAHMFA